MSDQNDTLDKAKERTRDQVEQRILHKEELHDLIRRFVAIYKDTVNPDNFDGDIEPEGRDDLIRGVTLKTDLREKWAVRRAAEHFRRDERTVREALNPSTRSRGKR
jgi:hypothetical protein